MHKRLFYYMVITLFVGLLVNSCAHKPPDDINNICQLFSEKTDWYKDAKQAEKNWGTPMHVSMAIMYQESKFIANAKPERTKLFGVIPWKRKSDAYGYAQAKDDTWKWYQNKTNNPGADRDDFDDAIDFIAWYVKITHHMTGVSKWDAYHQYLAYHEGHGGYKRGTYNKKSWLTKIAKKVDNNAKTYAKQLATCRKELDKSWWQKMF